MKAKSLHINDLFFSLKGLSDEHLFEMFPYCLILAGYRGSIAHNMYIPNSELDSIDDKDIMGVTIPPLSYYFGMDRFDQKETFIKEYDTVVYELRKYINLLLKSNPNVLSLVWLKDEHYIWKTKAGQQLIDNRDIFISKRIYHSFTGYAYGQMKRMTHSQYEGYMGQKRKELVSKHGYDTKNAAHLIRLLRMGIEFLKEGELHVWREDAPQLIEIKRGGWTLEQVKREANNLFATANMAYVRCDLPNKPNYKKANKLLVDILEEHFGNLKKDI